MTDLLKILDEFDKRREAATPGPWIADQDPDFADRCLGIASVPGKVEIVTTDSGVYGPRMNDAAFIAAARTEHELLSKALRIAFKALTFIWFEPDETGRAREALLEIKGLFEGEEKK